MPIASANAMFVSGSFGAEQCAWPSIGRMTVEIASDSPHSSYDICTFVYVGQGVIVTAGHCLSRISEDPVRIAWGDYSTNNGAIDRFTHEFPRERCEFHPSYNPEIDAGVDLAFCDIEDVLESRVKHMFVPQILVPGDTCGMSVFKERIAAGSLETTGWVVGAGITGPASQLHGEKRFARVRIDGWVDNKVHGDYAIRTLQPNPCGPIESLRETVNTGDSGGALYVPMVDGSYQLLGIAAWKSSSSRAGGPPPNELPEHVYTELGCDHPSLSEEFLDEPSVAVGFTDLSRELRWLEKATNKDFSPCHHFESNPYYGTAGWVFDGGSECEDKAIRYQPELPADHVSWSSAGAVCLDLTNIWHLDDSGECNGGNICNGLEACTNAAVSGLVGAPIPKVNTYLDAVMMGGYGGDQGGNTSAFVPQLPLQEIHWLTPDARQFSQSNGVPRDVIGTDLPDFITTGAGADIVRGADGGDYIMTGAGDDVIYPGGGADFVVTGPGDDLIILPDSCRLGAAKALHGDAGWDILISPLPASELTAMGFAIFNIEEIRVLPGGASAACE